MLQGGMKMAMLFNRERINRQQEKDEIDDLESFISTGLGNKNIVGYLKPYKLADSSIVFLSDGKPIISIKGTSIHRLRYRTRHLYKLLKETAKERGYTLNLCDEINYSGPEYSIDFYDWNGAIKIDGKELCASNKLKLLSGGIEEYIFEVGAGEVVALERSVFVWDEVPF